MKDSEHIKIETNPLSHQNKLKYHNNFRLRQKYGPLPLRWSISLRSRRRLSGHPEKVALKADPLSLVHDYRWLWQNDGGDRTAVDISLKADTWRSCKLSLPAASVSCRFTHPWPCLYAIPSNNPMDIIRLLQAICCSPSSLYTNDVVGRRKYQPNPLDCHFPRTWI